MKKEKQNQKSRTPDIPQPQKDRKPQNQPPALHEGFPCWFGGQTGSWELRWGAVLIQGSSVWLKTSDCFPYTGLHGIFSGKMLEGAKTRKPKRREPYGRGSNKDLTETGQGCSACDTAVLALSSSSSFFPEWWAQGEERTLDKSEKQIHMGKKKKLR